VYEEFFWEQRVLSFEYLYVGLPALNAEEYISGENLLGMSLSALMRAPAERKAQLAAQGLQRLVKSQESPWRKFLLGDCLVAYSALEKAQQRELIELLAEEEYREARVMTTTWYDQGIEQGLQQGRQQGLEEGQRRLVLSQLEARFGPLSHEVRTRVASWPVERLEWLGLALVKGGSLRDLGLDQ
jgi:predicted transposase YdaD